MGKMVRQAPARRQRFSRRPKLLREGEREREPGDCLGKALLAEGEAGAKALRQSMPRTVRNSRVPERLEGMRGGWDRGSEGPGPEGL